MEEIVAYCEWSLGYLHCGKLELLPIWAWFFYWNLCVWKRIESNQSRILHHKEASR